MPLLLARCAVAVGIGLLLAAENATPCAGLSMQTQLALRKRKAKAETAEAKPKAKAKTPKAKAKTAEEKVVHQIRESLICAVSQNTFEDPVVASDGFTYERSELRKLLKRKMPSPRVRGPPLDPAICLPNLAIREVLVALGLAPKRLRDDGKPEDGSDDNPVVVEPTENPGIVADDPATRYWENRIEAERLMIQEVDHQPRSQRLMAMREALAMREAQELAASRS